uniref:Guanine nucleotide-binding protein subunit beta-like protein n=1 Tax=Neobodo designis TaxID=312471 RepID=A0A7S1MCT5_NEODS|mmetsp:Transcript_38278/g.118306  ORF Transcript_38278/g.118306 Transcript_38278/m.118306 type:complete len:1102 (+) Transcript_38278:248-3553(+)|eukprot:CAMPEP_0174830356 /NCGR_PEP_ID=MMETSP1114-20130205/2471_1 /TAXON_ID=312471 /ORGANISM="Neobodo designis, Strain CCAP 1951/1" /LENGTH=1101 /DNA_ID=CAMNT_0016064151 /DNA_START=242 /DNA_END=3547 /DNA_ORIENTATION=+
MDLHNIAAEFDDDDARRSPAICWAEDDRVFCMASMEGGRIMTGGGASGDISLYDSRTGEREAVLSGHTESVLNIKFVPELNALFTASADSTVRMWALDTLQNAMVFEGHRGFVVGLYASATEAGTGLYSGSDDRSIKQWNVHSGACVHTYKGHKGPVNCIAVHHGNGFMYSGSSDGLLKLWEMSSRRCTRTIEAHNENIWTVLVLSDARVITGSSDSTVRIWADLTVPTNGMLHSLTGHRGKVRVMLAHEPMLFTAGADSLIHVWNTNTANRVERLHLHEKQVSGLTLENNQLCSCGFDRLIARWDVADLLPKKQPVRPYMPLSAVRTKELELAKMKVDEINQLRNKARMRNKPMEETIALYKELPVNFVVNALDFKVESSRLSCEVLLYIPFLICFVVIFLLSRPIEDNFYMVKGVGASLADSELPSFKAPRTFDTIHTKEWFAGWLDVVAREVWANRDPQGRPVFRGSNLLVGGLRLRTQRVTNRSCDFPSKRLADPNDPSALHDGYRVNSTDGGRDSYTLGGGGLDAFTCYGDLNEDNLDTEPFYCADPRVDCPANAPELLDLLGLPPSGFPYGDAKGIKFAGQLRGYSAGGHYLDLLFNDTQDVVLAKMRAIMALGFVDDRATRLVDVNFHLYNPPIDLFVGVHHILEIPYGGSYIALLDRDVGYEIFTFTNTGTLVFESFFFAFVLFFIGVLINEAIVDNRKGNLLGFFLSWWNIMEFANLITFLVLYGYRWTWMGESGTFNLAEMLSTYEYPEDLQRALTLYQYQVWCSAICTILTFLKLLKYVRLNDRLNVLTRTLAAAQQHLAGVILIFVYVVFGFALAGFVLFGGTVFQYRSLSAAYVSLLRLLLGDVDYEALSVEQRTATLVYFWAYNTLCLWILLNFLVAVISDAFADVSKSKASIPLDVSIVKVYNDAKFECLPKSIKLKLTLLKHRRTQTTIVRETLEAIMAQRDRMVDADAAQRRDYDELDTHMLHKDDFLKFVPDEYFDMHTEEFLDEVWKDIAWEYHFNQLAAKGQEQSDREQIAQEEVLQALRQLIDAFPVMDAIRHRLESHEAKLLPFASAVEAEHFNSPSGGGFGRHGSMARRQRRSSAAVL